MYIQASKQGKAQTPVSSPMNLPASKGMGIRRITHQRPRPRVAPENKGSKLLACFQITPWPTFTEIKGAIRVSERSFTGRAPTLATTIPVVRKAIMQTGRSTLAIYHLIEAVLSLNHRCYLHKTYRHTYKKGGGGISPFLPLSTYHKPTAS